MPRRSFDDGLSSSSRTGSSKLNYKAIAVHIGILLIFLLVLYIFFGDFKPFGTNSEEEKTVVLVGELNNLSLYYKGNLSISSNDFSLKSSQYSINDGSHDIHITNFDGYIFYENESIVLRGNGSNIEYDKNAFSLDSSGLELVSEGKTSLDLHYDDLSLFFDEGIIKLDKVLTYEFENFEVNLHNYTFTMSYDRKFSFSGTVQSFELVSFDNGLKIMYDDSLLNASRKTNQSGTSQS